MRRWRSYDQVLALDPDFTMERILQPAVSRCRPWSRYETAGRQLRVQAIAALPTEIVSVTHSEEIAAAMTLHLQALDRHAEALADFDRAIAIRPDHASTHFGKSVCLLQTGDLPRGWQRWQNATKLANAGAGGRLAAGSGATLARATQLPSAATRPILLHAEQGLGGHLAEFCPVRPACGEETWCSQGRSWKVQKPLWRLLAGFPGTRTDDYLRRRAAAPFVPAAARIPTGKACHWPSAPPLELIPTRTYLAADPEALRRLAAARVNGAAPGFAPGLIWAGGPGLVADRRRSMALEQFFPLAECARGQPGFFTEGCRGSADSRITGVAAARLHRRPAGLRRHRGAGGLA